MAEQLKLFNKDESQGKKCTKCGKWKIFDDFHRLNRNKDGRAAKCKECRGKQSSEYLKRPEIKARQKAYGETYRQKSEKKALIKAQNKVYRQRPEIIARRKSYSQRPEVIAQQKKYRERSEIREKTNKRAREKRKKCLKDRLAQNIKAAIGRSVKHTKSGRHWEDLVSYTLLDLKKHLEKLFQPGMTWENYGEWHIDHKIPLAVFNFERPEDNDFRRCWKLENLQPLWALDNIKKNAKLTKHFQPSLRIAL